MKSRNPGWRSNDHWNICDRCGFAKRTSELRETWEGLIVCEEDWEPRQPQDLVRGVKDNQAPVGLTRPEPEDVEVTVTRIDNSNNPDYQVPGATNNNEL